MANKPRPIRASDAEGIIFVGNIEAGVPFVRQYGELGLDQRIYSRGLSLTQQLFDDLGPLADGIATVEEYYSQIDEPGKVMLRNVSGSRVEANRLSYIELASDPGQVAGTPLFERAQEAVHGFAVFI